MFQTIVMQNLDNFGHREDLHFGFQNFKRLKILEIRIELGPLVSGSHRLTARTRLPIARATMHLGHSTLHATPCGQRCGHRTSWSSPPPRDMRFILALLEPEKLTQLSSLSHPCSQLPRSVMPCSATPPRCSTAHFRTSRRRSGCAKATSSSTA
jgi:hypothetical protein